MDLVIRCRSLPHPGETIIAESSGEFFGGKGANQAVAAARAGGQVQMVGRVGDDSFASRLRANLDEQHIDSRWVHSTRDCPSGVAVVAVDVQGQNSIMVSPGANARVTPADVEQARSAIESSDVLLLQLEIPVDAVLAAMRIARGAGARIILDPAPAPAAWPEELLQVDLLCPNELEALTLAAKAGRDASLAEAAMRLHELGARHVAITLGESGALLSGDAGQEVIASYPITTVDTTAAGDAFAGALAVHWAEQGDLAAAVRFANAAGALAASREGAQSGMGTRREIESLRNAKP